VIEKSLVMPPQVLTFATTPSYISLIMSIYLMGTLFFINVYHNTSLGTIIIKALIFEMEMLFGSCLVCFTMTFVWNWISVRRVYFDSEVLGTGPACSFRVNVSPITVLAKFCPRVG